MLVSALPFIFNNSPYAVSATPTQIGAASSHTLLVPAKKIGKLGFFLRYSFVSFGA